MNAQLSLATIAFSEGDLEQAKRQLAEVENAELTSEQRFLVMYYLANTHYSLREFKAARALFEEMIASYPESESADALLLDWASRAISWVCLKRLLQPIPRC